MADEVLQGSDKVMQALEKIVKGMGGGEVSVGFPKGATYPDGTPVAQVAYWNEFGHGGKFPSPPRSFFRTMVAEESPSWPAKMARLIKATDYDGPRVLDLMGEDIAGALDQSIRDSSVEPLSPTTLVLRKRFGNNPGAITLTDVLNAQTAAAMGAEGATGTQAKPLNWTGHMKNSIKHEVK